MNRHFTGGSTIGLAIFIVINLISAHLSSSCGLLAVFRLDPCFDDIVQAGWPIPFYEEGGFVFRFRFNPFLFMIDLWVGAAFAIFCGWALKKSLSK